MTSSPRRSSGASSTRRASIRPPPTPESLILSALRQTGGPGVTIADPPPCPTCSGPMELRRAYRGRNAGGLFWGCLDYPDCKGTRDQNEGDTPAAQPTDEELGPPPECPQGHGPMVLKT